MFLCFFTLSFYSSLHRSVFCVVHCLSQVYSFSFTCQIEIKTAPADFRFPTTNQTRHCFTRYVEYHRCVNAKGDDAGDCDKFAKYYRSLCPGEWVEKWNEQRENGTFPGPLWIYCLRPALWTSQHVGQSHCSILNSCFQNRQCLCPLLFNQSLQNC